MSVPTSRAPIPSGGLWISCLIRRTNRSTTEGARSGSSAGLANTRLSTRHLGADDAILRFCVDWCDSHHPR